MVVDISFKITYRGPITAIMKRRKWNNEVEKPSWSAVGLFHKRTHLQKHFHATGAAEYGYYTRSAKYIHDKQEKVGHNIPLVYTGQLRAEALGASEVRPTSKGVKVVLRARVKGTSRLATRMGNELRAISDAEAVRLARVKDANIRGRLSNVRAGWTTIIH